MKKLISLISALALTSSCVNLSVFAADSEKPVPADIGAAAYESLFKLQQTYDLNMDGVITMEELTQARTLTLDLDGATSIDWLADMKNCAYLFLSNGSFTDLSCISELPKVESLSLTNIPVTDLSYLSKMSRVDTLGLNGLPIDDISFIKDMNLDKCYITDMPQISVEQRFAVTRYEKDVTVEKGFNGNIGMLPKNLFGKDKVHIEVEDTDIVSLSGTNYYIEDYHPSIFGKNTGSTTYTVSIDGTELLKGTITVTEPNLFSPPLHDTVSDAVKCSGNLSGTYYMCLENGTLYTILNDKVDVYAENVKAFTSNEVRTENNIYYHYDYLLKNDGTLTINDVEQEGKYSGAAFGCFWNDKGELFSIYPQKRVPVAVKISDSFKEFLDDGSNFFVDTNGEVIRYTVKYDTDGVPTVSTESTGIFDPIDSLSMMILTKDNVLWKYNKNNPTEKYSKISEDVVELAYREVEGLDERYIYYTSDEKAYEIGNSKEVTPVTVTRAERQGYKENRVLPSYIVNDGSGDPVYTLRLIHTTDNTMTFTFKENHMSVTNVEQFLYLRTANGIENGYAYFTRTDGSIWQYDIAANECREMVSAGIPVPSSIKGDINGDGDVLVSDLLLFQKWLLGGDASMPLKVGDINGDGSIDVFDLCSLRKMLLNDSAELEIPDSPAIYNLCKNLKSDAPATKEADEAFINGQMNFAAELFKNAAADNENTIISPYSVMQALAMTANGADEKTREEMQAVLGGVDIDELNKYLADFNNKLFKDNRRIITNVNSIWAIRDSQRMIPQKPFINKAARYYGADFFLAPFDNDTLNEINGYVSENTDGNIQQVLDSIDPDEVMYLINTVIFNADWENRYYGDHPADYEFTNVFGEKQPCALMGSTEKYIFDENTDGFVKNYANSDIAFAALLPHEDVNINDYIDSLTGEKLQNLLTQDSSEQAYCAMLKFGYSYENELKDELTAMGMETAFDKYNANFTKLNAAEVPTYINDVTHKTFINVNEKGTFAGAATVVKIMAGGGAPEKKIFLDRPFVYCLFDKNTGIPLFIGTVMDMSETE